LQAFWSNLVKSRNFVFLVSLHLCVSVSVTPDFPMARQQHTNRVGSFLLVVLLAMTGCERAEKDNSASMPAGISAVSLLAEAGDFSVLARPVDPAIKAKMFSSAASTNKVMLAHLAPEVIGDMDYGFFSKVETGKDGIEATLAEFDGPGAVTWVWSANPVGTLKLYIDGQNQPALSMPFADFLQGSFLPMREPFGTLTSRGYDLHFPIVHAKHCKLVLVVPQRINLAQLYYQISWQALPTNSVIHPFDLATIQQESVLIKKFGKRLLTISQSSEPPGNSSQPAKIECLVKPGQTVELFREQGPLAIEAIRFTAQAKSDLSSLWMEGSWDGEAAALRAPLHMLAGVSPALENTRSLPATVSGSTLFLRWFMPFASEGKIACTNPTDHACRFTVEIWTRPIDAPDYPLRFHANYSKAEKLRPTAGERLTFADVHGAGRFAGCVLGVDSRSDQWWGEGDNIVWLDNTNSPVMHGTGTEDYFGFAWCSPVVFNHPFRGQTRVIREPQHWVSNMHRYHFLDQLPFQNWGRFQFLALGLGGGEMDWTATMIWYEQASALKFR
jgi:hypothetical protein